MKGKAPGEVAAKGFFRGTHRLVDPRETILRVRPLLKIFGITRVADITGLDRLGIPTVAVYRPNARLLSVAQGKGLTRAAAEASGLMEAIEHFHAERADLPLRLGTYKEMHGRYPVVEIEELRMPVNSVFHSDLRQLWTTGVDLLGEGEVWLPFECVHLDGTFPSLPGAGSFVQDSNGLASGNQALEAISHALFELIERDAHADFSGLNKAGQDALAVNPNTIDDADALRLLEACRAGGLEVGLWHMPSRCGVPAFSCVLAEKEGEWRQVAAASGLGAHTSPTIALLRAITEAAQSRLTMISGARDDIWRPKMARASGAEALARTRARVGAAAAVDFRTIVGPWHDTFDEEVAWLLGRIEACGCSRVIAVDLTHPAIGIPVFKLVVPSLRKNLKH